jgi:hypothetical protein
MVRFCVLVCALLVGGEAQAQFFCRFAGPPVIVVSVVVGEEWHPVPFGGTVSYCLDGQMHYATDGGAHWRTGQSGSAKCSNVFVEPFDCFGTRIPKHALPVTGWEKSYWSNGKTYWVANGETYFQSWVLRGDEIVQVLVKIVTVPAENAPSSQSIEPSPMDSIELIPQAQ